MISKFGGKGTAFLQYRGENHDIPFYLTYSFSNNSLSLCLINKYSASDGDLFPWGFRALGLGKLIGTRTWGGIIGISGPLPYMDGTDIRVPFFTSYDPKTGNWIIENHGVDPDILIDNDPIKEWNGEDQQLDRAIEEVMKQLKERKPLAPVPAPRDWSHK